MNLLEKESSHQRAEYLKYKKLKQSFAKKKTFKEDTVILYDNSDRNSSSRSEDHNSRDKDNKTSISYDSETGNDDNIINSSTDSEE